MWLMTFSSTITIMMLLSMIAAGGGKERERERMIAGVHMIFANYAITIYYHY